VVAEEMTGKLFSAFRGSVAVASQATRGEAPQPVPSVLAGLSPREHDILRGIARGESNKEIARTLGIAETTVKIHVQHVLRKLSISSRVQAAVLATEHGLA
jgi:two-component system nitrate/nitrite response regulator NarL